MSEPKTDREHLEAITQAVWTSQEQNAAIDAAKQHLSSPESEKPTGTIFELDIFRERLERKAHDYGTRIHPATPEAIEQHLLELAAELKTLIDNCMKQYVHTASPESDGAAEFFPGTMERLDDLCNFWREHPERSASRCIGDVRHLQAVVKSTPTPSPPTPPEEIELCKQLYGNAFVYDGQLLDPAKVQIHTATPPTEGEAEGPNEWNPNSPFKVGDFVGGKLLRSDAWASIANAAYAAGASTRGSGEAAEKLRALVSAIGIYGHGDIHRWPETVAAVDFLHGLVEAQDCDKCGGTGECGGTGYGDPSGPTPPDPCEACDGTGKTIAAQNPSRGSDGLREAAKKIRLIAAGLGGAKTADLEDARAYAESAAADLQNLAAHLDQHNRKDG